MSLFFELLEIGSKVFFLLQNYIISTWKIYTGPSETLKNLFYVYNENVKNPNNKINVVEVT